MNYMKNKRTKEEYELAVKNSVSIAGVCRLLGIVPVGGNYRIVKNSIKEYGIDTSHFTGSAWNKGKKIPSKTKFQLNEILKKDSTYGSYKLKLRLFKEGLKKEICERCKMDTWMGKPIPLELHHINGDNNDNRFENLQILCPNCHAQTDSYRGFNKGRSAQNENSEVEVG